MARATERDDSDLDNFTVYVDNNYTGDGINVALKCDDCGEKYIIGDVVYIKTITKRARRHRCG